MENRIVVEHKEMRNPVSIGSNLLCHQLNSNHFSGLMCKMGKLDWTVSH